MTKTKSRILVISDLQIPYHHEAAVKNLIKLVNREKFDLVINMLLGRYADHHIRELKPRVRVDRTTNQIEARKGGMS